VENGKPVREARDTQGRGTPDVLTLFDAEGHPKQQELIEGKGSRPNKKLFLAPDGSVVAQCLDTNGDGRFDARARIENGQVVEALIDTKGKGVADQREIYEKGVRVRLDADTNGDRKPDVIQYFSGNAVVRQDEDTNFDGVIDRRFENGKPVALSGQTAVPPPLGALDCGEIDRFWSRR